MVSLSVLSYMEGGALEKTALINEFCKGETNDPVFLRWIRQNRKILRHYPARSLRISIRDRIWELDSIRMRMRSMRSAGSHQKNDLCFVIDEYPYLAKAKSAVSSILQHLIDHRWVHTKTVSDPLRVVYELYGKIRCSAMKVLCMAGEPGSLRLSR